MNTTEDIKTLVRETYSNIAAQSKDYNAASCCGASCCSTVDYAVFSEDYSKLQGYVADADLGLGCGVPTEFAQIKEGDTVIDLGSGAGNDAFVARAIVGVSGKVIGIDMTEAMIQKARENNDKLEFNNVEFRLGDIEKMPITSGKADVVISNCVLNLVPDKEKAFTEILRVLKPGGHFCVSDIVLEGILPSSISSVAEMYAGCVAGASQKSEYLQMIERAGFENISIVKEREIQLPDDILSSYMDAEEIVSYRSSGASIRSVTVYADKPNQPCCDPSSGCC
jgi:arsenite methyltransferase